MAKRWKIRASPDPGPGLAQDLGCPGLFARLLHARGLGEASKASAFLGSSLASLHDPFLLSGMRAAVERAKAALSRGERICVYGDYDVDGVTSTALLMKLFSLLGGRAGYFIPDRVKDGYGLSAPALRRLHGEGYSLIVTVDCGVSAVAEAAEAKALGLDLIITDHHVPGPLLPDCLALVNPKCSPGYPYDMLGGVGVAWKFAQALLTELEEPRKAEFLDHMLELVALGTVCDVAPLDGENRALVREGVRRLKQGRWLGLRSLSEAAGLKPSSTDAGHLGFVLGPRLNAGGRVGDASQGVRLLLSKDPQESRKLAAALDAENKKRQGVEKEVLEEALAEAEKRVAQGDLVLVLWGSSWHPGVVGLAASRILEKYSRPVLVHSVKDGLAKGSGRSRRPLHLVDALEAHKDLLEKFGGHEFAAGLTIRESRLELLRRRLNAYAGALLTEADFQPSLEVDAWCGFHELDSRFMDWLQKMEPFGLKNPRPVLAAARCQVLPGARAVGGGGDHLKLSLRQGARVMPAIAFKQGHLLKEVAGGAEFDAAFSPSWNDFNGSRTLQLEIKDLKPCGSQAELHAAA